MSVGKKSLFALMLISFIIVHSTYEMMKVWSSPSFVWWGTESCHPNIPSTSWHVPILHMAYFIFVTIAIALMLKDKQQKEVK